MIALGPYLSNGGPGPPPVTDWGVRMKKAFVLSCSLLLALGLVFASQHSRHAVTVDPDVHHIVLENDHIRVFEAKAAPGYKSPMHTHLPFLLVSLDQARIKLTMPDGQKSILDVRPGQIIWVDGTEHSWELFSGNLHVIGVEVKSAAAAPGN
jgi:beta-alanine degradation protein BauB